MSSINQALQVIAFAAGGCAFKYIAGVGLFAGINLTDSVNATISATISTAEISINKRPELLTLSINLIAIWLLVLLGKLQGRSSAATEA